MVTFMPKLNLEFVESSIASYVDCFRKTYREGESRTLLHPWNKLTQDFVIEVARKDQSIRFYLNSNEGMELDNFSNLSLVNETTEINQIILFETNADRLSVELLKYVDCGHDIHIIAPTTEHFYKNKPLFLITIPKSGTHLLFKLAEAFGYGLPMLPSDKLSAGKCYYLEYSNSHTSARDFFIDTVRRAPFGNRMHPFVSSPALFIYRNPLDILVSEANYYHRDGKTAFASYLGNQTFDERLLTLIDDPWLLGSIRDRIGNFIAWTKMENVIPVSYEELVGPQGGGDSATQTKLIWSIQLKLHIPGNPIKFGELVFDDQSPTFNKGRIGNYSNFFSEQAKKKFYSLNQDFMKELGYDSDDFNNIPRFPKRIVEYRNRPFRYSKEDFRNTPINIENDYYEHNIVQYRDRYYGVHQGLKDVDFSNMDNIHEIFESEYLDVVKYLILSQDIQLIEKDFLNKYNIFKYGTCYYAIAAKRECTKASLRSKKDVVAYGQDLGDIKGTLQENQMSLIRDVAIFGTGNKGLECYQKLTAMGVRISFFLDNSMSMDEMVAGIPVISPSTMTEEKIAQIDGIIVSSQTRSHEMKKQLQLMAFPKKVIHYDSVLI